MMAAVPLLLAKLFVLFYCIFFWHPSNQANLCKTLTRRPATQPTTPSNLTHLRAVLDPRTRQILFKMVNKGFVDHVHGAISTGKEANVYDHPGKTGIGCVFYAFAGITPHATVQQATTTLTLQLKCTRRRSSCSRTASSILAATTGFPTAAPRATRARWSVLLQLMPPLLLPPPCAAL